MTRPLRLLTLHEGNVLRPYRDSLGFLTIGRGRCLDTNPLRPYEIAHLGRSDLSGGITEDESVWLCLKGSGGIESVYRGLNSMYPWFKGLDEVRQAVLVDMAYNLGIPGLAKWVNTLSAVQYGRFDDAAARMMESKWAQQVGSRAPRLVEMMRSGKWPADLPPDETQEAEG